MSRKTNATLLLVGLVLVGVVYRAKTGQKAKPTQFRPWTASDVDAFVREVGPSGVPLDAALLVYASESGLDPAASSGIAWGICQAIGSTLKAIGWTQRASDFGKLTVAQQAPWVARLLAYQIRSIGFTPTNALDLYVANFSPMAAKNHSDVLYRSGTQAYEKNRGLDRGKKGFIDRADLQAALDRAQQTTAYRHTLAQVQSQVARKVATNG